MLSSRVCDWHQGKPYNAFLKDSTGKQPTIGCVPLSVGMLLSYYEKPQGLNYNYPDTVNKFDFDWDLMLYSTNTIMRMIKTAQMLTFLGNQNLLKTDYNSGSATKMKYITSTLATFGSKTHLFSETSLSAKFKDIVSFMVDGDTVDSKVYKSAPLIAFGEYKANTYENHAWVIDGVVTREKCRTDSLGFIIGLTGPNKEPIYSSALPMWHCVRGQEYKKCDGWYVYLKEGIEPDTVQYDPFSKKVNFEGLWPTGQKMPRLYEKWLISGGYFPETIKK